VSADLVSVDRRQLRAAALGLAHQELRAGRAAIPLSASQATAQAMRLRRRGLTYAHIAVVMDLYHGHACAAQT